MRKHTKHEITPAKEQVAKPVVRGCHPGIRKLRQEDCERELAKATKTTIKSSIWASTNSHLQVTQGRVCALYPRLPLALSPLQHCSFSIQMLMFIWA